jgi:Chaperone of endosialidase
MTANKRTFEVDRFLTRQLLLRYPDNTPPAPNQAIFTDGNGGTYYSALASSNSISSNRAFNQVYLADTNSTIATDLSFNILTLQGGPGVKIRQGTTPKTVVFETALLVPSTFTTISTANGNLIAVNPSSILAIETNYGVNVNVSSNKLIFGGNAAFGQINVQASTGQTAITATSNLSSFQLTPGFGIAMGVSSNNITIGATFSSYALNQMTLSNQSTFTFQNTFNSLSLSTSGNLNLTKAGPSTLLFQTNSFSKVSTPAGILYASTTNESLNIRPGYGLNYSISSNYLGIDTNLPSSFSVISTSRGSVAATNSTNTLTLSPGYGIDYAVSDKNITIKLASTYGSAIVVDTGPSTIATPNSIFNISQGDGMLFSTATTGELLVRATDFNRIDVLTSSGTVKNSIFSYNTSQPNPVLNKTFRLQGGPGTNINANQSSNTITITTFSSVQVTGPPFAYANINVISSCQYKFQPWQDISGNTTTALQADPEISAIIDIVGVQPMYVVANNTLTNGLIYIGLDTSTLMASTNAAIYNISTVLDSTVNHLLADYISINTISTAHVNSRAIDASSISILGSVVLSSNPTTPSYLTVANMSTNYAVLATTRISTINDVPPSTPLVVFNYGTSSIGINIGINQPQANLEINGLVLAQTYATYSDSSLKNFITPLQITENELTLLKPWNFTWKEDGKPDIGFAADDVERLVPQAVKRAQNGLRVVDYGRLSVIAISALQETNKRLAIVESTLTGMSWLSNEVEA